MEAIDRTTYWRGCAAELAEDEARPVREQKLIPEVRNLVKVLGEHFGYADEDDGLHVPQCCLVDDIEDGCREGIYVMLMGGGGRTADNQILLTVRVLAVNFTQLMSLQLLSVLADHRVGFVRDIGMEIGVSADYPGCEIADIRCVLQACPRYPDGYVIPVARIERVIIDLETNGSLEEGAIDVSLP